jgi:hypothetical protein
MSLVTVSVKARKWPEQFARLAEQLLIRVHGLPPHCRDDPARCVQCLWSARNDAGLPGRIFGAASASATGICVNQPCYIRNFTLLFPADGKNAPCSAKIGVAHKLLKKLVDFIAKNRLSLQFLKISLQIANCREERPARLFRF